MIRWCGDGVGYSACLLLSHLCICMECVCLFPFSSSPHAYSSYIYIIKTLLLLPFSLDIIHIWYPYTQTHKTYPHMCIHVHSHVRIHTCIRVYMHIHTHRNLCLNLWLLIDRSIGRDLCEYVYSVHMRVCMYSFLYITQVLREVLSGS